MKIFVLKKNFIFILLFLLIIFVYFIFKSKINYALEMATIDVSSVSLESKFKEKFNSEKKIAYLTFDDGPSKKITPKILDILREENVKATFFVVGKHVKEYPELVNQAFKDGHFIANHGYTHNNNSLYKNNENFVNEILDTDSEIAKAIGVSFYCSHVFRFPNGYTAPICKNKKEYLVHNLSDINYFYIDWNCLNKDSERKYSKAQLLSNLKVSAKGKGILIILMHDTGDVNNTYDVLKDSINYLKSEGYEFRNFYEVLSPDLHTYNK